MRNLILIADPKTNEKLKKERKSEQKEEKMKTKCVKHERMMRKGNKSTKNKDDRLTIPCPTSTAFHLVWLITKEYLIRGGHDSNSSSDLVLQHPVL